jgi:hypothetical protein
MISVGFMLQEFAEALASRSQEGACVRPLEPLHIVFPLCIRCLQRCNEVDVIVNTTEMLVVQSLSIYTIRGQGLFLVGQQS